MVIEIPRWLDDAIDGQKWTLIGLAAIAVFWTATVAWYVVASGRPPPPRAAAPAPRAAVACAATPRAGPPDDVARAAPCVRPGAPRDPRPRAAEP